MCLLCASLHPTKVNAPYTNHLAHDLNFGNWVSVFGGGGGTTTPTPTSASLDPLAAQLTNGFWAWTGASQRSFVLDASRQVTVDLTGLESADERVVARLSLIHI